MHALPRRPSALLGVLLLAAAPHLAAQTWDYVAYFDLDDDSATGCSVSTVDGPFDGVERLLTTTVAGDQVTALSTADCVDPVTDTFSPPTAVSSPFAPPWPVGLGNGTAGADVIETYLPLAGPIGVIRLGFSAADGAGNQDALLTVDGSPGGAPILLGAPAPSPVEIPTLGTWILLLFTVLLALLALHVLRREPRAAISLLVVGLLAVSVATLWAAVGLDGLVDDWAGLSSIGLDPALDAAPSVDILAAFGQIQAGTVCLRIDATRVAPPDARDDTFAVDEDMVLSGGNVLADNGSGPDTDPLAGALTVSTTPVSGPANGALVLNADGTFTYTPAPNFDGSDAFVYEVSNAAGGTATATVTIIVNPIDDPPQAVDDPATIAESAPATTIDVLANDTDIDGGPIGVASVTQPPNGTVVITGGGSALTYQPDPGVCNDGTPTDDFTYTLTPGGSTATVQVTVPCFDDPPTAVDDAAPVAEDAPATAIDVLANDTDPDGGPIAIASVTQPANGTVVITGGGTGLTYQPDPNYCNDGVPTDDFTYTLAPGGSTATVQVTVPCNDDPPTAVDDSATVTEDDPATAVDVLANDTDPDGGPIGVASVTQPANGTVVITGGGTGLTYQPDPNACNDGVPTDDFTYTLAPGGSTATVRMTVTCVNDPPMAVNDAFDTIGNTELRVDLPPGALPAVSAATTSTLGLLDNDSDPVEMSALSVAGVVGCADVTPPFGDGPACSTANAGTVLVQASGQFSFVPAPADPVASDTFQYQLSDGTTMMTGTVTINRSDRVWYVKNDAPGGGNGTSPSPFDTLAQAETASLPGDVIFVFEGDGTTTGHDAGIVLKASQRLHGEGIGLSIDVGLNGNPAPTNLVAVGNKPKIDNTAGPGVSIVDTSGTEVRGLEIDGTVAGVQILITAGINTALVADNTLTGDTRAFEASASGGSLDLSFARNVGIVAGTSEGVFLDGSLGGTLNVVSFADLMVDGASAGAGIVANGVVFDTTPGDGDFTGDTVAAGPVAVGSAGDPVSGPALVLTNVSGDLAFGTLDLYTDGAGAIGLDASGTGALNAPAGTGFQIMSAGGTIFSASGPAVDLDPLTSGLTFASISSLGSPVHAIRLHDVAGIFAAAGGTLANSTSSAVVVTGTTPGDSSVLVLLDGMTINHPAGPTPVLFGQNSAGLFNLTGSTIAKGGGRILEFDAMNGGSLFAGTTVSTMDHHGARIINSAGIHDLPDIVISTPPPAGVDAVVLQNNTGTINIGRLAVTTVGSRGLFAMNGGTLNITDNTSAITTTGHSAIEMASTAIGSGATFATITANATGANEGIDLDGVTGAAFQVTGTTTVNTTGGGMAGIDIATSSAPFTFASVNIDATGGAGINLLNNTGTVTINGGDVTGATGPAVDVDQGGAGVTYNGTINNSTGRSVEVTTRADGTVAFGGAITDTGNGIFLDNNDVGGIGTVTFTGNLSLTTGANPAFTATNGGVVNVLTGTNTLSTTTATALNIANTTIGASDVTFRSISAGTGAGSGGTGIILDNTGTTGGLTVTGTGAAGSGGTIRNKTGANGSTNGIGVYLNQTRDVSLSYMQLNDFDNFAIRGTNVTNFTLANSTVTATPPAFNGNSPANDEGSVSFDNLLGAATFTNDTIERGDEDNLVVTNTLAGSTLTMGVTGGTIGINNLNDGILVESQNNATLDLSVIGTTFLGSAGDHIQCNALDTSTMGCTIRDNTFQNAHPSSLGSGVTLSGGSAASNITMTYDVSGSAPNSQTFRDSVSSAITVNPTNGAGSVTGTIRNNKIGVSGVANSGSSGGGAGIAAGCGGSLVHTTTIDNNDIDRINGTNAAIDLNTQIACILNATVTNNTANELEGFTLAALYLFTGGASPADTATLCADVRNNTFDGGATFGYDVFVDQLFGSTSSYRFPGYPGGAIPGASPNALDAFLSGQNTLVQPFIDSGSAVNVSGAGMSCP